MNALLTIPTAPPSSSWWRWTKPPRRPAVPPADRRFFTAMWFCIPGWVEPATEFQPQRTYPPYCGAPPGYRCRCGAQLAGHDFGDEDVRP